MTKQEFDAATKINFGEDMASDERARYYEDRRRINAPRCYFARRAAMTRRGLHVLDIGSRFRAPQAFAARTGRSMIGSALPAGRLP